MTISKQSTLNNYVKTKHGIKAVVNGKYSCMQCGMEIEANQLLPYCYFCENYIVKNIKQMYNEGVTVGLLSKRFKMGYIKIRTILELDRGDGCGDKSAKKVIPTCNLKSYKDYIEEKIVPVKDSMAFLHSKIKS